MLNIQEQKILSLSLLISLQSIITYRFGQSFSAARSLPFATAAVLPLFLKICAFWADMVMKSSISNGEE